MTVIFTLDGPSLRRHQPWDPTGGASAIDVTAAPLDDERFAADIREVRCPEHGEAPSHVRVSGASGDGSVIKVEGCCSGLYVAVRAWLAGSSGGPEARPGVQGEARA